MTHFRLRGLLALALIGIAAQVVGRLKVVHAGARTQDLYATLTVLGVVLTSFSLGVAFVIFARSRVRGVVATIISLVLALCLVVGLAFLGIYWPWIFE